MATTSAGNVRLDLTANTKPFERQADAAAGRVKNSFTRSFNGASGALSGLGAALGKIATIGAFAHLSKQCIQFASDLYEVQNVVDVTFPRMSKKVEEFAQSAATNFGLSEQTAKEYIGRLGAMAEATGFTEEAAYDMASQMTALAGDIASFYNISSDEAYEKLQSVFTGITRPMYSLGVVMTQATLDAYALENGYNKTTSAMTATELAALRLAYVTDHLSNTSGDFVRTSGSWANQIRLLQLNFQNLGAAIGTTLIAALLPVVRLLNSVIAAATVAARAVANFVSVITGKSLSQLMGDVAGSASNIGAASLGAADSTDDLAAAQGGAAKAAKAQDKAQKELNKTLAGFDKINKLASNSANLGASGGGGGGSAGGGGGVTGIDIAGTSDEMRGLDDVLASIQKKVSTTLKLAPLIAAFNNLKEAAGRLSETLSGGLKWAYDNVLKPLADWTLDTLAPDLVNLLADAIDRLNDFCVEISEPLGRFLEFMGEFIKTAWTEVLQPLGDWLVNVVTPKVLEAFATAFDVVTTAIENLSPVAEWIWKNVLKPFGEFLAEVFEAALDGVNEALDYMLEVVQNIDCTGAINSLDKLKDKIEKLVGWIKDVIEWWQKLNDLVNSKDSDPNGGGGGFSESDGNAPGGTSGGAFGDNFSHGTGQAVYNGITIPVRAYNDTKEGIDSTLLSLKAIPISKTTSLFGSNDTKPAVTDANKELGNFKDKSVKLSATRDKSVVWGDTSGALRVAATDIANKFVGKQVTLSAKRDKSVIWGDTSGNLRIASDLIKNNFNNKQVTLSARRDKSVVWGDTSGALRIASDLIRTKFVSKTVDLNARDNTTSAVNSIVNKNNNKRINLTVDPYIPNGKKNIGLGLSSVRFRFYAKGGFAAKNTPHLAVVGDNPSQGEYVLPESSLNNALQRAALRGAASNVQDNSTMTDALLRELIRAVKESDKNVYLDSRDITRAVVNNINREVQSTGRSPLLV